MVMELHGDIYMVPLSQISYVQMINHPNDCLHTVHALRMDTGGGAWVEVENDGETPGTYTHALNSRYNHAWRTAE